MTAFATQPSPASGRSRDSASLLHHPVAEPQRCQVRQFFLVPDGWLRAIRTGPATAGIRSCNCGAQLQLSIINGFRV